jgi:hypothetical protein
LLLPSRRTKSDLPGLQTVEARLEAAGSPEEIVLWTRVRRELIEQNDLAEEGRHRRQVQLLRLGVRVGLSISAVGTALYLLSTGAVWEGRLALGAGLYILAPTLVEGVFRVDRKGGGRENA